MTVVYSPLNESTNSEPTTREQWQRLRIGSSEKGSSSFLDAYGMILNIKIIRWIQLKTKLDSIYTHRIRKDQEVRWCCHRGGEMILCIHGCGNANWWALLEVNTSLLWTWIQRTLTRTRQRIMEDSQSICIREGNIQRMACRLKL